MVRVLLIEDNPGDARLIREMLAEVTERNFTLACAESLAEGLRRLEAEGADVVLLDLTLPDSYGFNTLGRVRSVAPAVAVVVLTGIDDGDISVEMVRRGAQDYLVKGHADATLLSHTLKHAVERNSMQQDLIRTRGELQRELAERELAERRLSLLSAELARSNRELQDFASIASHDLKEPLRKIQTFSDFISRKDAEALSEDGRDYLSRMMSATGRMAQLIDALLAYSRVTTRAHPFTSVNLTEAAREATADLEISIERTGGRVEIGELGEVVADPVQMRQLMQNLIGNALKYHREGVPPVVKVYAHAPSEQGESPNGNGMNGADAYQFSVEDNGIGFEQQNSERIFQVFQRLHGRNEYEGTGLGLAICKKIVERHGGHIEARGTPGTGATFTVTLPRGRPPD